MDIIFCVWAGITIVAIIRIESSLDSISSALEDIRSKQNHANGD